VVERMTSAANSGVNVNGLVGEDRLGVEPEPLVDRSSSTWALRGRNPASRSASIADRRGRRAPWRFSIRRIEA
jgi:hypothetical protein